LAEESREGETDSGEDLSVRFASVFVDEGNHCLSFSVSGGGAQTEPCGLPSFGVVASQVLSSCLCGFQKSSVDWSGGVYVCGHRLS
jgi:hypothetical protein